MKTKYRITQDEDCFYIVEVKYWFFPFWIEYGINGFTTYRRANDFLNEIKRR